MLSATSRLREACMITSKPEIRAFFDEPTNTVSYLVWDPATKEGAIIDPVLNFDHRTGEATVQSTSTTTRLTHRAAYGAHHKPDRTPRGCSRAIWPVQRSARCSGSAPTCRNGACGGSARKARPHLQASRCGPEGRGSNIEESRLFRGRQRDWKWRLRSEERCSSLSNYPSHWLHPRKCR
jgi:hypothetical protein